jgi:acyl-coenzyme A thioesterase PaaI-like protein
MNSKAIQDYYSDNFSHCYGCGRLNDQGLKIKSYWDGEEAICTFQPQPYHIAIPGYVYGGLIASIIDCHSIATASAALAWSEGLPVEAEPAPRFLTASLKVDYIKPTPLGVLLTVRARAREIKGRKVVVTAELLAGGEIRARGEVVAVKVPEKFFKDKGR